MKTLEERFWEKVDCSGDCWEWTAHIRGKGYGGFWKDGKMMFAHRVAYELEVGKIPTGLEIDHLCRNRKCVNPHHLEPVTTRENVLRGEGLAAKQSRQTHCKRGHEFVADSWYPNNKGGKVCRKCESIRRKKKRKQVLPSDKSGI